MFNIIFDFFMAYNPAILHFISRISDTIILISHRKYILKSR